MSSDRVVDHDDQSAHRQLDELLGMKQEIQQVRQAARLEDTWEALTTYRSSLEKYILEARPVLEETQLGRHLLHDAEFGPVEVHPPDDAGHDAAPRRVPIRGLLGLTTLENPVEAGWHVVEAVGLGRERATTRTVSTQPPTPILDNLFATLNSHLADRGIGVESRTQQDPALIHRHLDALPAGYEFTDAYHDRVDDERDLVILVSDADNERGTGKTTFSLWLAHLLDRTAAGVTTEKVAIEPDTIADAYTDQPQGSALVLDEAEGGLSKYEAASASNKAMRELVSMGRVEEKYLVLNLPASSELDRDLLQLCDFWFTVEEKGRATAHRLAYDQYNDKIRTPKTGKWWWVDLPQQGHLRDVYTTLTEEKRAHLRGDTDASSQRLERDRVDELLEDARAEAETEARDELIREVYQRSDELTQGDLASIVDLSRSRVADILSSAD